VLSARRVWWPGLLVAGAFVGWLVLGYGYQLSFPYTDSPGYGIAAMANRAFYWSQGDIRIALAVTLVVSMAILLLHRDRRLPAGARRVVVVTALTVAVWMAAAQVTTARGMQRSVEPVADRAPRRSAPSRSTGSTS
jgi:hypothetical protein